MKKHGWSTMVILLMVILAFGSVDDGRSGSSSAPNNTQTVPAAEPESALVLESWRSFVEYGYSKVTGEVTNTSSEPLRNVEVVASFYTADGTFVKEATAIVEYNPILPGQTTPFLALTTHNPQIAAAKIGFKHLFGETIPYVDRGTKVQHAKQAEQMRQLEESRIADAQKSLEASDEWQSLEPKLASGLSDELRIELKEFISRFEGTEEAGIASREIVAFGKVRLAMQYSDKGNNQAAKRLLQEVVADYGDAAVADEAEELLGKLQ